MKNFEEIKACKELVVKEVRPGTMMGWVTLRDAKRYPYSASIVIGRDKEGWEHVSVSPMDKRVTPSWDAMCQVKDMIFGDEEEVVQIMPKKSQYVNLVKNCLHLWRKIDGDLWK